MPAERIFPCRICQNSGMKKIKQNPLGKTRDERETCFPEAGREEIRS